MTTMMLCSISKPPLHLKLQKAVFVGRAVYVMPPYHIRKKAKESPIITDIEAARFASLLASFGERALPKQWRSEE